jgi:hypothetical protein
MNKRFIQKSVCRPLAQKTRQKVLKKRFYVLFPKQTLSHSTQVAETVQESMGIKESFEIPFFIRYFGTEKKGDASLLERTLAEFVELLSSTFRTAIVNFG